ncbi:hypothetical protein Tco_1456172, partial [Tanacetum coccineum]
LNENVALLHFIEEGDEVGGYEANRATFSRFMTRVLPYPNLPQTIPAELLPTLKELDEIDIQANNMSFTGYVRRKELALKTGTHVYELGDTWNTLVKSLGLEAGMICVLTKNKGNKMWLEAFNNDGSMITNVVFKGAATLRHEQLTLTKFEKFRMVPHAKAPNIKNHMNVYGHWRIWAEACRFPYTKIIRFKYMSNATDLDVKEGENKQYRVFHIC